MDNGPEFRSGALWMWSREGDCCIDGATLQSSSRRQATLSQGTTNPHRRPRSRIMKYQCQTCKTITHQAFQEPSDLKAKCPNCGNVSKMITPYASARDMTTLEAANRVLPELLAVLSQYPQDVQKASLYLLETALLGSYGHKIVVRAGRAPGSGSATCSACSNSVGFEGGIMQFRIRDRWRGTVQEIYLCNDCKEKALWEQELDLHESNDNIRLGLA
jgi:hypothetical protein